MANLEKNARCWALKKENITQGFITTLNTADKYLDRNIMIDVDIKQGSVMLQAGDVNVTPEISGNQDDGYSIMIDTSQTIMADVVNGYVDSVDSKNIAIKGSLVIDATKMSHAISNDGLTFVTTATAGYNKEDLTDSILVYQGENIIE